MSDSESAGLNQHESQSVWKRALSATVGLALDEEKRVVVLSQFPVLHKRIGECDKSPKF